MKLSDPCPGWFGVLAPMCAASIVISAGVVVWAKKLSDYTGLEAALIAGTCPALRVMEYMGDPIERVADRMCRGFAIIPVDADICPKFRTAISNLNNMLVLLHAAPDEPGHAMAIETSTVLLARVHWARSNACPDESPDVEA